ncbi:MAG: hypothetical protein IPG82_10185 [Saprospiraceae bacterium]|nr:hypothetical protein [Saprospiraceae bacterium]
METSMAAAIVYTTYLLLLAKSKVPDPLIATTAQGGVYTTEQAVSVCYALYSTACASCHGPARQRYRRWLPPLTGSLFLSEMERSAIG